LLFCGGMTELRWRCGWLLGAVLLVLPLRGVAQTAEPSLDDVLTKMHEHFDDYLAHVPNLYADEHVVSSLGGETRGDERSSTSTETDSLFRLKRSEKPGEEKILSETRLIKSVDHRPPPEGEPLSGPVLLNGVFSYATSFFSVELKRCYDYKLVTGRKLSGRPVLTLEYAMKPIVPRESCPVHEPHSGRVFLEPESLEVLRMEQKRPHHELTDLMNKPMLRRLIHEGETGIWEWSIDYAPVELDGRTFWMPKTIFSNMSTNNVPMVHWGFLATYKNYHLMTAHSTILPVE